MGLLENTTMGKFFLKTLLAVAEMERNLIVEFTQEGKAIAKQYAGFKEGRLNKYTKQQLDHAMQLLATNSFEATNTGLIAFVAVFIRKKCYEDKKEKVVKGLLSMTEKYGFPTMPAKKKKNE